jgi:hypothetical protein
LTQQCQQALLLGDSLEVWFTFGGIFAVAARSAFETTDRGGFLATTVADVTLRRESAFDFALLFLAVALSRFGAFSMERVDMDLGSFGSRRRN